jgi:hypothetical protein
MIGGLTGERRSFHNERPWFTMRTSWSARRANLEVNPLRVTAAGAVALDARVATRHA